MLFPNTFVFQHNRGCQFIHKHSSNKEFSNAHNLYKLQDKPIFT